MSKQFLPLSSLFVLLGLGCSLSPAIAAAPERSTPNRSHQGSFEISQLNLPAPNSSSPGSTAGGGKRGGCLNREARTLFVPVMPNNQANTLSSSPTLWLNLPENQAVRAEFSIFKQTGNEESLVNYQVINDLNGRSGLLRIDVPENTLVAGTSYWWNLTLACDAIDHSADIDLWGSLDRLDPSQLSIRNDATVLQSLAATLMGQNSYLSMDQAEANELGTALRTSPDLKTLSRVETRLRKHFLGLQDDYAKLNQSIRKLQQNSNVDATEIESLKARRNGMVLELAQLSAYFDAWGDTVNFLASYRAENPDEWQSLLKIVAPSDNLETDVNEYQMVIKALSTVPNFQGG